MEQSEQIEPDHQYPISNLLHYIWASRPDLRQTFDLRKRRSRIRYCEWLLINGTAEYGLRGWSFPDQLLRTLTRHKGMVRETATRLLTDVNLPARRADAERELLDGANLVGYARGEFGMGEHVRSVAESLNRVGAKFTIINVAGAGLHGAMDERVRDWISDTEPYATNIFHVNADVLPILYSRFGPIFFEGRYNIGYWAWELGLSPDEYSIAASLVDEIWAPSEFVANSFRRFGGPVVKMPVAVELPHVNGLPKSTLGFDDDEFVFLFAFDAASYIERKNPLAVVRAFLDAFPSKSERVRLLLKTMNIPAEDPRWAVVAKEAAKDPRIAIIDRRLRRDELIAIYEVCDAFVSLHRSEGFGRCIAEAMLLGRPVIATGYSGSNEFINDDTACVVDYKLVPVEGGSYPFWDDQVWAEPSVAHAAAHMRRLYVDEDFRSFIAKAGQAFVRDNFNMTATGARYAQRLNEIRATRPNLARPPMPLVE